MMVAEGRRYSCHGRRAEEPNRQTNSDTCGNKDPQPSQSAPRFRFAAARGSRPKRKKVVAASISPAMTSVSQRELSK